jgi:hypothetical protein
MYSPSSVAASLAVYTLHLTCHRLAPARQCPAPAAYNIVERLPHCRVWIIEDRRPDRTLCLHSLMTKSPACPRMNCLH